MKLDLLRKMQRAQTAATTTKIAATATTTTDNLAKSTIGKQQKKDKVYIKGNPLELRNSIELYIRW